MIIRRFKILFCLCLLLNLWIAQGACLRCPRRQTTKLSSELIEAKYLVQNENESPFEADAEIHSIDNGAVFSLSVTYHNPNDPEPSEEIEAIFDFFINGLPSEQKLDEQEPGAIYHYDDQVKATSGAIDLVEIGSSPSVFSGHSDLISGTAYFPKKDEIELDLTFVKGADSRRIIAHFRFSRVGTSVVDGECDD